MKQQRILNWHHNVHTKLWVPLEKFLAGRNLSHSPWLSREHWGLSDSVCPVTNHALKIWDTLNAKGLLAPPVSPLEPLRRLPLVHSWGTALLLSYMGKGWRGALW